MMFVVYGVIIFLASGIGAFLGGGSGVIIKPLLTLLVDDQRTKFLTNHRICLRDTLCFYI